MATLTSTTSLGLIRGLDVLQGANGLKDGLCLLCLLGGDVKNQGKGLNLLNFVAVSLN